MMVVASSDGLNSSELLSILTQVTENIVGILILAGFFFTFYMQSYILHIKLYTLYYIAVHLLYI